MITYTPPRFGCPTVSVIIPMYNAEKYIAECLESLLAQTFRNFEVVIVDDCSTDSSCAIVESLAKRFGGRLNLYHTEKNSGSGAIPRNKGLELSRGEYVFIMDNDDLLTPTALEELYTLAKDFDVDVVHCERYFETTEDLSDVRLKSEEPEKFFVDRPTLEPENFAELFQAFMEQKYWSPAWCKLFRRNLAIENGIEFPPVCISEDDIWTYGLFLWAKKILHVPNIVYVYRQSAASVSRVEKTPQQRMKFWLEPILSGLESLEKVIVKHEFFRQNPQYLYEVLKIFINGRIISVLDASLSLPPFVVYEEIKREFGDKLGNHGVLISALCSYINKLQREQLKSAQDFNRLAAAANNRIAQLEVELQRLKS